MKTSIAEEREGRGRAAAIFLFCGRCVVCILAARGRNALGCQKCGAHSQKESRHIRLLLLCGPFCTGPPLCCLLHSQLLSGRPLRGGWAPAK